jgi:GH25 family lysozyme M1 (1,4-beta-N-acetylmuramidase)
MADATPLRIDGADISHHQNGTLDYARAKRAGVKWLYHKATEGTSFRDPNYQRRRGETKAAGLRFGAYHFARPERGDAVAEARAFLAFAQPRPGDLAPCLDLEVAPPGVDLRAWAAAFIAEVRRVSGVRPVVYTPFDLGEADDGCIIWRPRYNDRNQPPARRWDIWQFSNGVLGVPDSCPGLGHVDLNTMRPGLQVADLTIPKEDALTDPRLERPQWRGRTNVDALTIACIERAEQLAGRQFVITQGSYQSSVAASAGTHDRGGVVDVRWTGRDSDVRDLRRAGMAAWHRTPAQGPWPDHIHAVVIGHPDLAPAAARQITAYFNGRNGLANNGPDDGPRLDPIPRPVWPWPPPPEDDMFTDADRKLLKEIHEDAERVRAGSWKRDKLIAALVRRIGGDHKEIEAALAELDED